MDHMQFHVVPIMKVQSYNNTIFIFIKSCLGHITRDHLLSYSFKLLTYSNSPTLTNKVNKMQN